MLPRRLYLEFHFPKGFLKDATQYLEVFLVFILFLDIQYVLLIWYWGLLLVLMALFQLYEWLMMMTAIFHHKVLHARTLVAYTWCFALEVTLLDPTLVAYTWCGFAVEVTLLDPLIRTWFHCVLRLYNQPGRGKKKSYFTSWTLGYDDTKSHTPRWFFFDFKLLKDWAKILD